MNIYSYFYFVLVLTIRIQVLGKILNEKKGKVYHKLLAHSFSTLRLGTKAAEAVGSAE